MCGPHWFLCSSRRRGTWLGQGRVFSCAIFMMVFYDSLTDAVPVFFPLLYNSCISFVIKTRAQLDTNLIFLQYKPKTKSCAKAGRQIKQILNCKETRSFIIIILAFYILILCFILEYIGGNVGYYGWLPDVNKLLGTLMKRWFKSYLVCKMMRATWSHKAQQCGLCFTHCHLFIAVN